MGARRASLSSYSKPLWPSWRARGHWGPAGWGLGLSAWPPSCWGPAPYLARAQGPARRAAWGSGAPSCSSGLVVGFTAGGAQRCWCCWALQCRGSLLLWLAAAPFSRISAGFIVLFQLELVESGLCAAEVSAGRVAGFSRLGARELAGAGYSWALRGH